MVSKEEGLNPLTLCPDLCSPHVPGKGWPLMLAYSHANPDIVFWCENCSKSFTIEDVYKS